MDKMTPGCPDVAQIGSNFMKIFENEKVRDHVQKSDPGPKMKFLCVGALSPVNF